MSQTRAQLDPCIESAPVCCDHWREDHSHGHPFLQCLTERFKHRRLSRLLQIKIDQETKLMGECTFHPALYSETLNHQTNPKILEARRRSRLAKVQADANKELTYQPKLINSSKRSTNVPIHERLYSLASLKSKDFDTPRSAVSSFELMLGQNAALKLYTDACQRQVRRSETEASLAASAKKAATPKLTTTTAQLVSSAIEKEAMQLLGTSRFLTRDDFFNILLSMGFAQTVNSSLHEAWKFVDYDSSGSVSTEAFLRFVTSLQSDVSLAIKFRELLDSRRFRRTFKKTPLIDENLRPPRITRKSCKIVEKLRERSPDPHVLPGELIAQLRKQADEGFVTPPSPSSSSECTFQPTLIPRKSIPLEPAYVSGFEKTTDRLRSPYVHKKS